MTKNIGIFENVVLNFKKNRLQQTSQIDLDIFIKVLACAVWADEKVKDEELIEVHNIIQSNIANKNDAKVIEDLVIKQISKYSDENWVYLQDIDNILTYILKNKEWNYAEYLLQIFKADKVISKEEGEIAKHLNNLVESKKFFEAKLGIKL